MGMGAGNDLRPDSNLGPDGRWTCMWDALWLLPSREKRRVGSESSASYCGEICGLRRGARMQKG